MVEMAGDGSEWASGGGAVHGGQRGGGASRGYCQTLDR